MKSYLFFVFLFYSSALTAQNEHLKHDYIWLTGYSSNPDQLEFGGTIIDFNHNPVDPYYEYRDLDFDISNTTMCNENGELIFSCNNYIIANRFNEVMENGTALNAGNNVVQDRIRQAVLALPSPGSDSTYILLHQQTSYDGDLDGNVVAILTLNKTVIDMSYDSDSSIGYLGKVIEKNIPVIQDTVTFGRLTATRHANGRDWWILQQEYGTNKFYTFLLNNHGLIEQQPQYIGENQLYNTTGIGQAVFSPDGSKYLLINSWDLNFPAHMDFFDFDRCTGLLSNFERMEFNVNERPRGVAVAANSELGYLATNQNYYQINLNVSPKELTLIQERNVDSPVPYLGQLAPNDKIYFAATGTYEEMHVIHNPNEEGEACNLVQSGFPLPTHNKFTIPNHPNYRLGRLIDSPCDTLLWPGDTTSAVVNLRPTSFEVFPNPSSDAIHFSNTQSSTYTISDYLGRILKKGHLDAGEQRLEVSDLPAGVYFLTLEGDLPRVAKFVVQRE